MKLAWITDIHLNFLDYNARRKFYGEILSTSLDVLLISGDIAEAHCLIDLLYEMTDYIDKPIYFILGNHDYYGGTVKDVRETVTTVSKTQDQLVWLPATGLQLLTRETLLIGQDGWADGRLGDLQNSQISLNDFRMITDLFQERTLGKFQVVEKMQQLADIDAIALQNDLIQAIEQCPKKIIILTHVPPFKEACFYNGQLTDDNWLPYYSSKVMGDVLMTFANENPSIDLLVLCGHTHSEAHFQPLANLTVKAGRAEYYRPTVQEVMDF